MFLSKKLRLCLASLICILFLQSYRYVDFSPRTVAKYLPFSNAFSSLDWEFQVIKPYCKCSNESNNYILIEKQQQQQQQDDETSGDLLIISLIEENEQDETQTKTYLFNMTLDEAKRFNKTCDLYNVLRRGPNQKIISYSLYGTNIKYSRNLEGIVDLMRLKYPGFTARVHYDFSVNKTIRCYLECAYPDVMDFCNMNEFSTSLSQMYNTPASVFNMTYMHKMMWRFLPSGDSFVDVFMSRDTDSFFTDREVDAVKEWLNSNKTGHIMRG